jgi:hypothetical protein
MVDTALTVIHNRGEEMANMPASVARFLKTEAELNQQVDREYLPTGLDVSVPRGALTEVYGPATSGKTSFLHTFLAAATLQGEFCALVDAANAFDPHACANADLTRLLWVRCEDAMQALKCADLLVHSGGWGVLVLDLGDTPAQIMRRLPISYWYRFRLAVENTPTAFLILEQEPYVKNCAAMALEMPTAKPIWSGRSLLDGLKVRIAARKPVHSHSYNFQAKALA